MNIFNFWRKEPEQVKDLERINHFLKTHLEQFQEKGDTVSDNLFDVTDFLLKEIIDMYESMRILYKEGHFRSCIIMARSILETTINLRYIYKDDTEKRASNYKYFSTKEYLKRADKMSDIPPKGKELLEYLKKMTEDYSPSGNNKNHWDGKSIREESNEIGSSSVYDSYSHLSTYLHSKFRGTRDLAMERPYNDYLRKLVFKDLLAYTLEALKPICEKFDLEGGIMINEEYPDKRGVTVFATNPKRAQEELNRKK
jgi:hypothetical protein